MISMENNEDVWFSDWEPVGDITMKGVVHGL